jgi:hypothetical protein
VNGTEVPQFSRVPGADGGTRRALWGWSPPDLPADTAARRRVDRLLPRTGCPALFYYAGVAVVLGIAPHLPERANLAADGLAALAAAAWCAVNFWRCRHAHCVVTSPGWVALSIVAFAGAGLGHSLIAGYEQPVFLGVLAVAVVFEVAWSLARGTNSIGGGACAAPGQCGARADGAPAAGGGQAGLRTRSARNSSHVRWPTACPGARFAPARTARAAPPGSQTGTSGRRLPLARR